MAMQQERNCLEVPTIEKRPIFKAYVREYLHNSYGQTYGTNVPP